MKLIIASDPNGGIGINNGLPWKKIDGDLARFKELTDNCVIVMGRKTWDSLPKKPLNNRLNFVVTRNKDLVLPDGAMAIDSLDHFKIFKNAWLIGGAELINSNWDKITEVHLTKTHASYSADTFIDLNYIETTFKCWYKSTYDDHTFYVWKKL